MTYFNEVDLISTVKTNSYVMITTYQFVTVSQKYMKQR